MNKKTYIKPTVETTAIAPRMYCISMHGDDDDPWTDEQWARRHDGDLWDDYNDEDDFEDDDSYLPLY